MLTDVVSWLVAIQKNAVQPWIDGLLNPREQRIKQRRNSIRHADLPRERIVSPECPHPAWCRPSPSLHGDDWSFGRPKCPGLLDFLVAPGEVRWQTTFFEH